MYTSPFPRDLRTGSLTRTFFIFEKASFSVPSLAPHCRDSALADRSFDPGRVLASITVPKMRLLSFSVACRTLQVECPPFVLASFVVKTVQCCGVVNHNLRVVARMVFCIFESR